MRRWVPRLIPLAPLGVLLVAALCIFGPPLVRKREVIESTPSPPPLFQFTPVGLLPGEPDICIRNVTLAPRSRVLRFRVTGFNPPGPGLTVTASGPRYRSAMAVHEIGGEGALDVPIAPPSRELRGRVCIRLQ